MASSTDTTIETTIKDKDGNEISGVTTVEKDGKILKMPIQFKGFIPVFKELHLFKERSDDIWICSYPKSGTNWSSEILTHLIRGGGSQKAKVHSMLEACSSLDVFETVDSPRLLNSHLPWCYLPPQIRESTIVYLIRNPLSVALSWYHHLKHLPECDYHGTPECFIESFAEELFPFFGSWFNHVREFVDASKNTTRVHLIYYEEMKQNPNKGIAELGTFLGLSLNETDIATIVEKTSIGNMKTQFKSYNRDYLIRKGEIAEWKNHVTPEFLNRFMEKYKEELKDYPELIHLVDAIDI